MKKRFIKVLGAALLSALLLTGCSADVNIDINGNLSTPIDEETGSNNAADKDEVSDGSDNGAGSATGSDESGDTASGSSASGNGSISDGDSGEGTAAGNGTTATGKLGTEASINAQYFVKIGDRTYFRGYGEDAFQNPCMWGEYMLYANGGRSAIYYYDEVSGETVKAFDDLGFGKIVFMDGVFYMNTYKNNMETPYVYTVDETGTEVGIAKQYEGIIVDYSDECGLLFVQNNTGALNTITGVDKKGNERFVIKSDCYIEYMDCYQDVLVYYAMDYNVGEVRFYSYNLGNTNGVPIMLGKLTRQQANDYCGGYTENIVPTWVKFSVTGQCYWGIAFRSGTANMFDGGLILSSDPWVADTVAVDRIFGAGQFDNMPYISTNEGGSYAICNDEPGSFITVQNTNGNNDLFYIGYLGEKSAVIADFADPWSNTGEYTKLVLANNAELGGDIVYAMRVTEIYDMDGAVGWRDGYRANKMEYVRIDKRAGKMQVILTLNHNKNYRG